MLPNKINKRRSEAWQGALVVTPTALLPCAINNRVINFRTQAQSCRY